MPYSEKRAVELRTRFGVSNGRFFGYHRYKNLNWYLNDDWFCYGDVRDEDIPELVDELKEGEVLELGWKELPTDQRDDNFFGDGGGLWLKLNHEQVLFDRREANRR